MSDSQLVLIAIRRLVRMLRLYDRAAQSKVGLSAAQLFILSELGKTPALSLNELSERTMTDQSSVSAVVTRLVEAGLVVRARATDDARRLALTLTRSGRSALQKAPPVAQELLLLSLSRLRKPDLKRFAATLTRLVDDMGADKRAPMLFEDEHRPAARRAVVE